MHKDARQAKGIGFGEVGRWAARTGTGRSRVSLSARHFVTVAVGITLDCRERPCRLIGESPQRSWSILLIEHGP